MKKITFILCLLIGATSFAQDWDFEKPDYKKIEKNIQDENTNLFYESIMNRFLEADSTMTLEEKRHLYYGYSFHENYSPYSRSDYNDSLKVVLQKEQLDSIDLKKIITFTDIILSENPFDLRAINYQLYSLEQLNNEQVFEKRVTQLRIIVDALLSSGNGKSIEEAFYVIYVSHEYDLLDVLGFQFGGKQSLIEHYDYLTVVENDYDIEGFYFDVTPSLNSMSKMLKQ